MKSLTFSIIARVTLRGLLALLFLAAGVLHLVNPGLFMQIMPPLIPFPMFCVLFSGVCELIGGVGLLIPHPGVAWFTRWWLILLLIAVFPANIYMTLYPEAIPKIHIALWILWARLPLQPLLIWGVWWVTGRSKQ